MWVALKRTGFGWSEVTLKRAGCVARSQSKWRPFAFTHACSRVCHWSMVSLMVPCGIRSQVSMSFCFSSSVAFRFCRATLCISAAYAVMRCLFVCLSVCPSVCESVTFVDHVKTNKDIFEIFSPSDSHTILVFPCQTAKQYSHGIPLTGTSNAGGVGRNRDSKPISL